MSYSGKAFSKEVCVFKINQDTKVYNDGKPQKKQPSSIIFRSVNHLRIKEIKDYREKQKEIKPPTRFVIEEKTKCQHI